ncbi:MULTISPECIES: FliH/SctL family protein [Sphingomonas]|uniref:FliH/SctL family protein n=1 Tax=Sphingomonas TaxID=13687 RepID=UPI0028680685|nr:FliH/SctL family protein [Sphingomonas sp. CGMCC 1.13658]
MDFGALGAAMSGMRGGFAAGGPVHFSPAPQPQHFRPATPGANPTAGWDPFDPMGEKGNSDRQPPHDAIDAARAEGFAEGMAAAERMAAERGEADAQALARIAAGLEAISAFDRDALAGRLRQTVMFLVSRLIGEAGVSAEMLGRRVESAVALLADSAEAAVLKLNPEDLPLVEAQLPATVTAVADVEIDRGGFRIETRTTSIEDGPDAWLAQLAAALDRAALPDAG